MSGRIATYISENIPVDYLNSGIRVQPQFFVNEVSTKSTYNQILTSKYGQDKANEYTQLAMSKIPKMKVELFPTDGQWSIAIKDTDGNDIKSGMTGQVTLDPQLLNVVKNYPHIIIAEYVLGGLYNNPTATISKLNGTR